MKKTVFGFILFASLLGSMNAKADDVVVTFKGNKVDVKNNCKDSVTVQTKGALVNILSRYKAHEVSVELKGKSDNGRLVINTKDKLKVTLNGVSLTSKEGATLWLKNKKRAHIVAKAGTENLLCVEACPDTATMKAAVIFTKDKIKISGKGKLNVLAKADGVKGINAKKDIVVNDLTLDVTTLGQNLGRDTTSFGGFGGFPGGGFPDFGGFPGFGGGEGDSTAHHGFGGPGGFPGFNMDEMPEEMKAHFEEMRKQFGGGENGGMPPFGGGFPDFGGGMPDFGGGFGGFGGFGGGDSGDPDREGGWGGKQRYIGKTKAIKSLTTVTINSGKVNVKTVSAGAEGIEGKQGVIINGGEVTVSAIDDAINANAPIQFNGGKVISESYDNDAVDANYGSGMMGFGFGGFGQSQQSDEKKDPDPAIIIRGGEVYAWSHVGSPEEGLDCDFSPIEVSGGTIFSMGAGMGEMPSVPTAETAKQPTVLLVGLNLLKGEKIQLYEGNKVVFEMNAPFSFNNSSSLLTHPSFKMNGTYKVVTKDYERTFTISEPFAVIR